MIDKWNRWKIPIIIVVFLSSTVFSTNYLGSPNKHIDDKKMISPELRQCYLCHMDGKVGDKSILENIENTGNADKVIYSSQRNSQIDPKTTPSDIHLSMEIQPINLSNISKEDQRFATLIIDSNKIIMNDIKFAIDAANKSNYRNFETSGVILKRDSQKYLDMTRDISVSYVFKNLSGEYNRALEDFYNAGKYIESGSANPSSKDIEKSVNYLREGTKHMNNILNVLRISGINSTKTSITKNNIR